MAILYGASLNNVHAYTGAELRQELQLRERIDSMSATSEEYARLGHAMGYVSGFVDAYLQEGVRGARLAQDNLSFCLPVDFATAELVRAVNAYLTRHREPQVERAPASAVLAMSFREAFPCGNRTSAKRGPQK